MRNEKRDYNFYFTHSLRRTDVLFQILKDGYIRLGKDLPPKYRGLGGRQPLDEIYGTMYFDNLKKKQYYWGHQFIFNPNIVEKYDFGFKKGLHGEEIRANVSDSSNVFWKKIDSMYNYLKTIKQEITYSDKKKFVKPLFLLHEIVFYKKISIRKYVSALRCVCTPEEFEKIKKLVAKEKYNIKLFLYDDRNYMDALPSKEIFNK